MSREAHQSSLALRCLAIGISFLSLISQSSSFYVPGIAPVEFAKGDSIVVKAVKMTSTITQLPYAYYTLPFCKPDASKLEYKSENLGEVLRGDRIVTTKYEVQLGVDTTCHLACNDPETPNHWTVAQTAAAYSYIKHQYYVHLWDNFPSISVLNLIFNINTAFYLNYVI